MIRTGSNLAFQFGSMDAKAIELGMLLVVGFGVALFYKNFLFRNSGKKLYKSVKTSNQLDKSSKFSSLRKKKNKIIEERNLETSFCQTWILNASDIYIWKTLVHYLNLQESCQGRLSRNLFFQKRRIILKVSKRENERFGLSLSVDQFVRRWPEQITVQCCWISPRILKHEVTIQLDGFLEEKKSRVVESHKFSGVLSEYLGRQKNKMKFESESFMRFIVTFVSDQNFSQSVVGGQDS